MTDQARLASYSKKAPEIHVYKQHAGWYTVLAYLKERDSDSGQGELNTIQQNTGLCKKGGRKSN